MNTADWKTLPDDVVKLFRKYRIISVQDVGGKKVEGYTTCNLRKARDSEQKILGDGFLLAPDCVSRFVNACIQDDKVNCQWLDWILFQVGGGTEAQRRANQAMAQVHERFLDERVRGFRDTRGQYHAPTARDTADGKWKSADTRFQEVLFVADQDVCEKLQVFGFYRHWPGQNNIYESAATGVRIFLSYRERITEMNAYMRKTGQKDKIIKTEVKEYPTVDSVHQAIKKIDRFFNSRAAREDVRLEEIYADATVRVVCPITYSASVRYGWPKWPISDDAIFEQCLENDKNWNDPWRKVIGQDGRVPVFFQFLVPMPSWIAYDQNHFQRITLQNICAQIPHGAMKKMNHEAVEFFDEENRKTGIVAICERCREEVKRVCTGEDDEYPIIAGPRVFETDAQVEAVVTAFEAAWAAVEAWAAKFSFKQIVVDYMPKEK